MDVLLISAYHTQSHAYWCQQLIRALTPWCVELIQQPARNFPWRCRGTPLVLVEKFTETLQARPWHLLITTSVIDLTTLLGLQPHLHAIPKIVYFHENQFAYPRSSQQHSTIEMQMASIYSSLSADVLLFNSDYNKETFLNGVQALQKRLPDRLTNLAPKLRSKSQVLPVPLEDEIFRNKSDARKRTTSNHSFLKILWNHRWEYDKAPGTFLLALRILKAQGFPFHLILVGNDFNK